MYQVTVQISRVLITETQDQIQKLLRQKTKVQTVDTKTLFYTINSVNEIVSDVLSKIPADYVVNDVRIVLVK